MLVMSDSEGPAERFNSKSSFSCEPSPLNFEIAGFFGLGDLSLPRCRVKSKSRSIDDSTSVSLAEDIAVQAVAEAAELPLLSDELDERPSPRRSEGPMRPVFPSLQPHFLFTPFDVEELRTADPVG